MLNAYGIGEPPEDEGICGGGEVGLPVVPKGNGGPWEPGPGGGGKPRMPGGGGIGCPGVVGCAGVVGCDVGVCGMEGFGY